MYATSFQPLVAMESLPPPDDGMSIVEMPEENLPPPDDPETSCTCGRCDTAMAGLEDKLAELRGRIQGQDNPVEFAFLHIREQMHSQDASCRVGDHQKTPDSGDQMYGHVLESPTSEIFSEN